VPSGLARLTSLFFSIFSFVGLLDSVYLTAKHFTGAPVPCTLFGNCDKVLTSSYSVIFGVPVPLWGIIYYFIFLVATVAYYDSGKTIFLKYLSYLSIIGLAASAYFVFVQLFLVKSICEFCMFSAATSTLLFISGMIYLSKKKNIHGGDHGL
jgi:uncharacterized membrane protein